MWTQWGDSPGVRRVCAQLATICSAIEVLKLCPQARWPAPPGVTPVCYPSELVCLHSLVTACIGGPHTTSRRKGLHTLKLTLTAKTGNNEILNTPHVSLTWGLSLNPLTKQTAWQIVYAHQYRLQKHSGSLSRASVCARLPTPHIHRTFGHH